MNYISEQYYEFLKILQKIFRITNTKEIKITKIDQGIICFRNEKGDDIEISTAHDVVQYCSNDYKNRELFTYDGVKIQPIGKNYDNRYNNENINGVSLIYNEEEINFFSFIIDCLAEDYKNPKKNKELKKTLSVTQVISYLEKFIIDPIYTRKLYDHIDSKDLVQPLINTMGEIKKFFEQKEIGHISYLNIDKENRTISFRIVTVMPINGKIVKNINKMIVISQSDISTISKNHYNIDYYGSILKCLHKDMEFGRINTRQPFSTDEFYMKLLSYSKKFDCLVSKKSITSAIKDQKTGKFTNVQETSTEYSMLPNYTQALTNSSIANTIKNQKIDKLTSTRKTSTGLSMPFSYTQNDYPLVNSSTEHKGLIPNQSSDSSQQNTILLVAATAIPGLIILFVFILAYCYCKKRNSSEVGTNVEEGVSAPLNNKSKSSSL